MRLFHCIILCYVIARCKNASAKDALTSSFIKDFIINEQRPTLVVMSGLCWPKKQIILLAAEIVSVGGRIAISNNIDTGYQNHALLLIQDLDCHNHVADIQDAIFVGDSRTPSRWLMLIDGTNGRQNHSGYDTRILTRTPLLPDSDVVLAELHKTCYYLSELYRPSVNSSVIETPRGWWNSSHRLVDIRQHRELFRRRRNLMRHTLTLTNVVIDSCSTVEHLPKEDRLELQYDSLAKMCWIIGKIGFEMLNVTSRYTFTTDWGYTLDNGSWTGMAEEFLSQNADLGTSAFITSKRMAVMDYVEMVAPTSLRFTFRQPPLSYVSNIFALPFATDVWLATVCCLLLSALALYLTTKWEARFFEGADTPNGSWRDVMLISMGAMCQQGCEVEPKKASGRIILLFMSMSLMAVYAAYSANIVVLLQASSKSISSMQQLHDSKLTLAANDLVYNHFWLKEINSSLGRSVYKKIAGKDRNNQFYDLESGVEKIRQGMFAFHSISEPVYRMIQSTFLESEKCDLVEIDIMNNFDPYQVVPKNSPYKELFRVVFKQIREAGFTSAIKSRYQVKKPVCSGSVIAFSSVGFTAFYPASVFLMYGIMLSVMLLFTELLIHHVFSDSIATSYEQKSNE